MSNDAANQLSPEAIEQILDGLLTHHQTEYDYERENIELKEKLETMSRQNSVSRRKYDRSDIRSTSPENVTPEARLNSSYRERGCGRGCGHAKGPQRSESYPQRNRSYGPEAKDTSGTSSGNASGTNTTRSPTSGHSSGRVQYAGSPENSTGMASGSSPISPSFDGFKPNDLIRGITDRLIEVGFHKRTRSSSGPPIMQRANVLERGSAFSTEPTSVPSFVCIFTVYIPEDHYGAPLTSIGRPLVPEGITTDRFTVIATYHPSYRHFVMDILDYCRCPVGFESNQLVDLMYLQNMGFLPLYIVYPRQPQTSYRYQVVQQWSICTLSASGEDVLWASNVDVMVQRIAGCMHRASESRSMSKTGHRRYLDSIASGCEDVCDVELYSKVAKMSSVPMAASVSLDYNENATLEWVPLHASPERQLPHARNCIPILRF